jgi:hypothetical protein
MTQEHFTQQLRDFLHRQPFQPFLVELQDGRTIAITEPAVAIAGSAAGFLSDTDGLVSFSCDEVRRMVLARWGAAS